MLSSTMTTSDYKSILKHYKLPVPLSKKAIQRKAEKILTQKLCRCIKKVDRKNEARAIGICTKTIFNKRGFKRHGRFTCKKKKKQAI